MIAAIASAFTGCLFENPSSDNPAPNGEMVEAVPYSVIGNTIRTPAYDDTLTSCSGNGLTMSVVHHPADYLFFEVKDATLKTYRFPDSLESGAVAKFSSVYSRIGFGHGIEGKWSATGREYSVVAGVLSVREREELESLIGSYREYLARADFSLEFSRDSVKVLVDEDHSADFIDRWNGKSSTFPQDADSARFDIDLKRMYRNTVELKGRKTGETVRLVQNMAGDVWYSSDVEGHPDLIYRGRPKSCPNTEFPAWYLEFLQANRK